MSGKSSRMPTKKIFCMSLGLELGLVLGGVIGTLLEIPLVFAGSGILLGLVIGTALER